MHPWWLARHGGGAHQPAAPKPTSAAKTVALRRTRFGGAGALVRSRSRLPTRPKRSANLLGELVDQAQFRRVHIPRAIVMARIDERSIDAVMQRRFDHMKIVTHSDQRKHSHDQCIFASWPRKPCL
jgi:hypothetical protein